MPKIVSLPHKDIESILERNGLKLLRLARHGAIYVHPDDPMRRTTVPQKNPVAAALIFQIRKQSQKPRQDFER